MPSLYTPYRRDAQGNVVDPPTIPSHERALVEASAIGDENLIEMLTEEYHEERAKLADRHDAKVSERRRQDEILLAQARQTGAIQQSQAEADAAELAQRREIDRLRAASQVDPAAMTAPSENLLTGEPITVAEVLATPPQPMAPTPGAVTLPDPTPTAPEDVPHPGQASSGGGE